MGRLVVMAAAIGGFIASARAQGQHAGEVKAAGSIVGDWQGTLTAGSAQLHLVLHVSRAQDGSLSATLDSVDQTAYGIPVSAITVKDGSLSMTVNAVRGTYEGEVNKDATEIKGTWTQGQPMELNFRRAAAEQADQGKVATSDIDGAWLGTLDLGAMKLHVVFHITSTKGGITATMDSPDQNATGIPVTTATREGASLKIVMTQLDGRFVGKISEDSSTISGTWTQHGSSRLLELKPLKDTASLERKRPQNPVRPLPYREEEVSYENKVQGDTLAGTLTIPPGKGPFTAVLLITGSGPQDRDETLLGHKPFLVLSDWLTRRGIEVLRVDDRGVGKSTGTFKTATTADFATDVEAGVAFLVGRPEVNPKKIGLIGHSEGGVIAPMVAARNHDVGFIVMMAGSGVPGDQILVEQRTLIAKASGVSKEEVEKGALEEREVLAMVVKEKDSPELTKDLEKLGETLKDPELGGQIPVLTTPWFRYFLSYDPAPALRKVSCPVLAINGEMDLQVPPKQNLPVIRRALEEGGNKNFEVDELPGLNHLFQTATTGSPGEYASIEETMSPLALDKMSGWILKLP
jgi:fermentation-respiration switch protein FrsA (DUF1100 family)